LQAAQIRLRQHAGLLLGIGLPPEGLSQNNRQFKPSIPNIFMKVNTITDQALESMHE